MLRLQTSKILKQALKPQKPNTRIHRERKNKFCPENVTIKNKNFKTDPHQFNLTENMLKLVERGGMHNDIYHPIGLLSRCIGGVVAGFFYFYELFGKILICYKICYHSPSATQPPSTPILRKLLLNFNGHLVELPSLNFSQLFVEFFVRLFWSCTS